MKGEARLYPDIEKWLENYLRDKYKRWNVETTYKTCTIALDVVLKGKGIEMKEAIGLGIKVDIVGILTRESEVKLALVEVKDKPLTLRDLGQLWGYTQLLNPVESFLISSRGLGTLIYILRVLKREDLLVFGPKRENMMKIAEWDERRKSIDYATLIPKL